MQTICGQRNGAINSCKSQIKALQKIICGQNSLFLYTFCNFAIGESYVLLRNGFKNINRKVKAYLSSVVERRLSNRHKLSAYPVEEDYSRVIFRITVNRDKRLRVQTNVYVPVSLWNEIDENVKSGEEKRVISSLKTKLEKVLEI